MKAVAKLKDEARKNEQAEEWEQAIAAYDEVLRITDSAEAELPLYNRIGDLYVRLGKPADAVTYYERAADHYAEAGLYNNAIALCNKALRYVPNRLELLRKLGQFSAAQGFLIDARRWYLEYAERQLKNGALDEAFTALEDFATVYEDAEIRELLGRQFRAHNRIGPAVIALKRAHALRLQAGEQAAAEALKAEILKLAPDAFSGDRLDTTPPSAPPVRTRTELPGFSDADTQAGAPQAFSASTVAPRAPSAPSPPSVVPPTEPPPAYEEILAEAEPETAGFDFDEKLAELELDRALSYEGATPFAEAPVSQGPPPVLPEDDSLLEDVEAEPEFEPEPIIDEPADAVHAEMVEAAFPEPPNAFSLDLPPLDLPPLDLPATAEPEPLPFLSFGESGTPGGVEGSGDLLPLLEFDAEPRGQGGVLSDLPQFETSEPMEPIDLDAAFASMSPPGSAEPKKPTEPDVWKASPAWLQPVPEEPPKPVGAGLDPFLAGPDSPWTEPLEFGYAPPPGVVERTEMRAPVAAEPPAPRVPEEIEPEPEELPEPSAPAAFEAAPVSAPSEPLVAPPRFAEPPEPAEPAPPIAEAEPAVKPEAPPVPRVASAPEEKTGRPRPALSEMVVQPAPIDTPITTSEPTEALLPAALREAIAQAPPVRSAAAEFARVQEQIHHGDSTGALHHLEELHAELAADGKHRDAWQACELLLQLDPGNLRALQQRVEYASTLGQRDLLLRSYLELARQLMETGAETKGAVIYQRVLDIDPYNEEAQTVVHGAEQPKTSMGYVDLFALISDETDPGSTRFMVAEKAPTGDEDRDFADMLAQFKQKVAENLSLSDTGAHYDLGLAFKEMGLIDEAIAEFQTAIKGGGERLKFYEELGQCFLLKQQYNVAVNVLNRALQIPIEDEGHLVGVYYTLGRSYEELGQAAQARAAYERVIGLDINFQDASQRLASL